MHLPFITRFKRYFLAIATITCSVLPEATAVAESDSDTAEATPATLAWAEVENALRPPELENFVELTKVEARRLLHLRNKRVAELAMAFYTAYPSDPRRWSAVRYMMLFRREFVNAEEHGEWDAKVAQLVSAMRSAPDLPADLSADLDAVPLLEEMRKLTGENDSEVAWEEMANKVLAHADSHPVAEKIPPHTVKTFMSYYKQSHQPEAIIVMWEKFAASRNLVVARDAATIAQQARGLLELSKEPIELRFTALDGREVDLHAMRGKVVLIDFWATWCGPCMQEMPNVRKAYQMYREKGFEVIGISCDTPPGEKGATSTARSGPQVLEFARRNDMPWPHHYEGKRMGSGGNTLAAKFAVTGIPATFLLDREGRLIATGLRGEKLLTTIERVLAGKAVE